MVKIDIISGFLGAGKTTLIKKLLKDGFQGEQVVLIENEFGEIGIDGGFLKEAGIQIREMNSGCICCSLVGDFGTSLKEVVTKYNPDRILIEPSGVGKLSDVIKAVQGVQDEVDIKLNSYTTVVDAKKCKMYMKNFGEFFDNQIQYAGAIIMSRTDIATEKKVQESLELLRSMDYAKIRKKLMSVENYGKIIVNAIDNIDVKIFCTALYRAIAQGKHYTFRTAAALVKAFGNISDKAYLAREEMINKETAAGGIIVVGSHTAKTTAQLNELKNISDITFIELNSDLVLEEGKLEEETRRVLTMIQDLIRKGNTVCVSTKRALLKVENDTPEEALKRSVKISDALQKCVGELEVTPAFVVAKGGITSSDVGVKALRVKHAKVLGQIRPGIPVWQTGRESKFPGIPYVIFPGNVGEIKTLREAVEILMNK